MGAQASTDGSATAGASAEITADGSATATAAASTADATTSAVTALTAAAQSPQTGSLFDSLMIEDRRHLAAMAKASGLKATGTKLQIARRLVSVTAPPPAHARKRSHPATAPLTSEQVSPGGSFAFATAGASAGVAAVGSATATAAASTANVEALTETATEGVSESSFSVARPPTPPSDEVRSVCLSSSV